MRRIILTLFFLLVGTAAPAWAQATRIFGTGIPPGFPTTDSDRRFMRTRLGRMLVTGTNEPACQQLLGGLFTIVAEAAPLLHERDGKFVLDNTLVQALSQQLSTNSFSAPDYFTLMVRRIRIEKHLPVEWVRTAAGLDPAARQTIDFAKIRFLTEELHPITSAYFTIPVLRERWVEEVERANSGNTASAYPEFREAYLDHEVAFGGLTMIDLIVPENEKGSKGALGPIVLAEWTPPDPTSLTLSLEPLKPKVKVKVKARLSVKQFLDASRLPKGHRILLRGRFWEIDKTGTEVQLREALIFDDRDWSQGTLLGNPAEIANCSAAVNDLLGLGGPTPWTGTH